MKKFFFVLFIILIPFKILPQGSTTTPYDTTNWSLPAGYSTYYDFYIYQLLSNPGGRINLNTAKMDSLFHDLVIYTDSTQMVVRNDTLILSPYIAGQDTFATTATSDSVVVAGFDSLDVLTVTPLSTSYNVNDILFVEKRTGYFKVYRNSSGTSGLIFNWIWIRKYQ